MHNLAMWIIQNIDNQVACFLEMLLILLCIHGVFKAKIKFTAENILLIICDLFVMALIDMEIVGQWSSIIVYSILFMYCIRKFERKFWETFGRFMLGLLLSGLIEVFASIIVMLIAHVLQIKEPTMLVVNILGVLVAILIFKLLARRKGRYSINFKRDTWLGLIVICAMGVLFIIFDYRYRGMADQVYYFIFLASCALVCISTISVQTAKHELEKKKLEFELQEIYGNTYKELIAEVRKNQHDFANQLGAIYSMHMTANSLEELVAKQREYGDVLLEKNQYEKILTGCNNSILAGYLYYKCVSYEHSNVQVDYQIHVNDAYCCLPLHEIIEILGILLTNAYENYNTKNIEKRIGLIVQESDCNLLLEVSNMAKEMSAKEIEKIFCEGYSSKGKNRGLGLARVKELASKAKADLIVENQVKENGNWLNFRVVIPKC